MPYADHTGHTTVTETEQINGVDRSIVDACEYKMYCLDCDEVFDPTVPRHHLPAIMAATVDKVSATAEDSLLEILSNADFEADVRENIFDVVDVHITVPDDEIPEHVYPEADE